MRLFQLLYIAVMVWFCVMFLVVYIKTKNAVQLLAFFAALMVTAGSLILLYTNGYPGLSMMVPEAGNIIAFSAILFLGKKAKTKAKRKK